MDHSEWENLERIDEELQETIEILQDAELMEAIREGLRALQNGDTVSLEDARQMLGLA
jgi:PHD/YefM family antitoxin component YafN of YafNO toxin-antitoxin module